MNSPNPQNSGPERDFRSETPNQVPSQNPYRPMSQSYNFNGSSHLQSQGFNSGAYLPMTQSTSRSVSPILIQNEPYRPHESTQSESVRHSQMNPQIGASTSNYPSTPTRIVIRSSNSSNSQAALQRPEETNCRGISDPRDSQVTSMSRQETISGSRMISGNSGHIMSSSQLQSTINHLKELNDMKDSQILQLHKMTQTQLKEAQSQQKANESLKKEMQKLTSWLQCKDDKIMTLENELTAAKAKCSITEHSSSQQCHDFSVQVNNEISEQNCRQTIHF